MHREKGELVGKYQRLAIENDKLEKAYKLQKEELIVDDIIPEGEKAGLNIIVDKKHISSDGPYERDLGTYSNWKNIENNRPVPLETYLKNMKYYHINFD